ncbi:MAG: hypothetical protein J0M09_09885 [Xanthomonadales bacterium]|nr:hypothetical protein [Xanthomonadales bacterium]
MLTKNGCLIFLSFLSLVACGDVVQKNDGNDFSRKIDGHLRVELSDKTKEYFSVELFNGTSSDVEVNGLISPGFIQSSVIYEAVGKKSERGAVGMPLIVDVRDFQYKLIAHGYLGVMIDKKEFAAMHNIDRSGCHLIRARYVSTEGVSGNEWVPSGDVRICFSSAIFEK